MILTSGHFCKEHNSRFFKNEKVDQTGNLSIWYSHKKLDGTGFCNEPIDKQNTAVDTNSPISGVKSKQYDGLLVSHSNGQNSMYVCNAMNNAVNLAANGAIGVDQIGQYFQKIYTELSKTAV